MVRAEVAMREADERREAFDRAFGASQRPGSHLAIYGASTGPMDDQPLDGFEAMHGRLTFPLAGRAEVPSPSDPRSGNGPGLMLVAVRDTAVRAVYPGRVVLVGQYLDYGMTVLLDHGDRYFSVYGRLSSAGVKLGDAVPERGRIGWISRHGSRRPTLYFELRKGTAPIDAARWLGL
jgi:septal ring factor EnvC (AmiA/AmiB activator)